ncbi:mitochondrial protein fmp25 [Favolaschia claudopus]|uniref:Mitochondrial protein fmp25 n=1 Tax=Favolaschia claudopus TaxID=2862362 RepID=A0AAW0APN4_9AGAR
MFKGSAKAIASLRQLRRAGASAGRYKNLNSSNRTALLASSAVLASVLWYSQHKPLHNDAELSSSNENENFTNENEKLAWSPQHNKSDTLHTLVWGSNRCVGLRAGIIDPLLPAGYSVKQLFAPEWLNNVALRDLALHEQHAACVDAHGDVYQWGEGYKIPEADSDGKPTRTLSGKDIVKLQLTPNRVFALSKSGHVYVLDANASNQSVQTRSSWWNFWSRPSSVDFVELTTHSTFGWGEKFTSISAGRDHLLAVTTAGRTFSYPINQDANLCGQLGFSAPNLSSPYSVPKSMASSSFSAAVRQPSASSTESNLGSADPGIRFCTTLYEIPVLKGIKFAQVATGARSSFARTSSGKVLAWGANEHGQLGLGSKDPSEPITVPTEVVLWPRRSLQASTRCLDVSAGGDLTGFTIERCPEDEVATVELLMAGDGQWGGLGNNSYSNVQVSPVRVKALSGLTEYNDATQCLQCIPLRAVSVSPTGHVLATLDPVSGRRDLHGWGKNQDYELGPSSRKPGTSSPMAVDGGNENGRVMLETKKAKVVVDLQGRVWGRGQKVEHATLVAISRPGPSVLITESRFSADSMATPVLLPTSPTMSSSSSFDLVSSRSRSSTTSSAIYFDDSDDEIVWGNSSHASLNSALASDDDFVVLSRPRSPRAPTRAHATPSTNVAATPNDLASSMVRLSVNEVSSIIRKNKKAAAAAAAKVQPVQTTSKAKATQIKPLSPPHSPSASAAPVSDRPSSVATLRNGSVSPSTGKAGRRRRRKAAKSQSPTPSSPTSARVGLGSRPIVDDISERASECGDEAGGYDAAVSYINSCISDPQSALIVELGLASSSLPASLRQAKAMIKSRVFLNVGEYLDARQHGAAAVQGVLHPSKASLIKDLKKRNSGKRIPLQWVKESGFSVLLVRLYY